MNAVGKVQKIMHKKLRKQKTHLIGKHRKQSLNIDVEISVIELHIVSQVSINSCRCHLTLAFILSN